jgi:hypothetical protein
VIWQQVKNLEKKARIFKPVLEENRAFEFWLSHGNRVAAAVQALKEIRDGSDDING